MSTEHQRNSDSARLDKLEALLWSRKIGNGLAIFPCRHQETQMRRICFQELGDEDGSNLGEELTHFTETLRDAIDALP